MLAVVVAICSSGCGEKGEESQVREKRGQPESASEKQPGPEQPRISPARAWAEIDNPEVDGWATEVLAERASAQLKKLGALFFEPGDLAPLLVPEFDASLLVPGKQEPVFADGLVSVERTGKEEVVEPSREALVQSLDAVRSQVAGDSETRHSKFKVISVKPGAAGVETEVIAAISYKTSDALVEIHARWEVGWAVDDDELRFASVRSIDFERTTTKNSGKALFSDVTGSVLDANSCYEGQLAHGMNHWLGRMPVRAMLNRFGTPGIALGDVNGDGLEDLYLCQEPGLPNLLFLQQQDGSAQEVGAEWGVDWIDDSRSALLLDFDNDGDQDLAVAVYANVVIARNEGGRFEVASVLPASGSTASLAAADFDNDGLLDLYVCAYVQNDGGGSIGVGEQFVYHDAENGAANSLFRNVGELEFSDVTAVSGMDANNRRWSFAASWEDFDDDGDQDLYVANDYGRNNLYRNEGGRFTDVAAQSGVEDSASGMASSWGDFDRDGRMDIYVSNMFSAAGSRITGQEKFRSGVSDEIRGRFKRFARGNTLFRNAGGGTFDDVSLDSHVNLGRWAWGSNFVDLNNDAWEDLVVANGYLTSDENGGDL